MKTQRDFELWDEFYPVPVAVDLAPVREVKARLGDKGIIRSHPFGPGTPLSPGQGSPWQSFCTLVDTEKAIYLTYDEPEFVHQALESILQKTLRAMSMWEGTPADMIEIGQRAARLSDNKAFSILHTLAAVYAEIGRPAEARKLIPEGIGLQGNLAPSLLNEATPDAVARESRAVLEAMRGRPGHIFNLGHGLTPGAKLENIAVLTETVRSFK